MLGGDGFRFRLFNHSPLLRFADKASLTRSSMNFDRETGMALPSARVVSITDRIAGLKQIVTRGFSVFRVLLSSSLIHHSH